MGSYPLTWSKPEDGRPGDNRTGTWLISQAAVLVLAGSLAGAAGQHFETVAIRVRDEH